MQNLNKIKEDIIYQCILKGCDKKETCLRIGGHLEKMSPEYLRSLNKPNIVDKKAFIPRGIHMSPNTSNIKLMVIGDNPGPLDDKNLDAWTKNLQSPHFSVKEYLEETWRVYSEKTSGTAFHRNLKKILSMFEHVKLEEVYFTQNVKCGGFHGTETPCAIRSICQERWLKKEIEFLDPKGTLEFVIILGKNALMSVVKLFEDYPKLHHKVITIPHPSWPRFNKSIEKINEYIRKNYF